MANEKRLIDANAFQFEPDKDNILNGVLFMGRATGKTLQLVRNCLQVMIDNAPTVDAVEVVHGRWIEDQVEGFSPFSGETYPLDVLQCSVCGEYFDVSEARNYCPNCGAKMDGDGNEDV